MNKKEENEAYKKKFLGFSSAIALFCTIICGIIITAFSVRLYKNDKFQELETVSELFINAVKNEYNVNGTIYIDTIDTLHSELSEYYNVHIYLYDDKGNTLFSPADSDRSAGLSSEIRKRLDSQTILDFDAKEVSTTEPSILYGKKFSVTNSDNEHVLFYLTSYSSTSSINSFTLNLILVFLAAFAVSIIPAMILIKRRSDRYAYSAQEFVRITESFSKGDFSERINASSMDFARNAAICVNTMADNMQKNDETSKTFIANVSHELRTPITTIGGFVDGILDGTIPKSHQHEYLVLVSNEIKRLRILISSMLNMTRFESGTLKPNFKLTNLTELAIQTVLMFEKKIDDKHIEIEGLDSERLEAVVDPDLIQQVIYNLVENAVKFVNEKGTISFRFEKEDSSCIISIRNTGEGLQNNEIQQVFDRFYKTDSSRGKDTTGLGLGLSISRKIIHIHNGQIIVKSVYGEYTEFQIQLPEKQ